MKMEKRTFRIGELANALSQKGITIETSVIRFWEKEFKRSPSRSSKGQRFYTEEDFSFYSKVQELLYEKKFTIQGAKKALLQKNDSPEITPACRSDQLQNQLQALRIHLIKIKELL